MKTFFSRDQKLITRAQFRPFYVIFRQNCATFWRASFESMFAPKFVVCSPDFGVFSPDFGVFSHVPKNHDLAPHTCDDFRRFSVFFHKSISILWDSDDLAAFDNDFRRSF